MRYLLTLFLFFSACAAQIDLENPKPATPVLPPAQSDKPVVVEPDEEQAIEEQRAKDYAEKSEQTSSEQIEPSQDSSSSQNETPSSFEVSGSPVPPPDDVSQEPETPQLDQPLLPQVVEAPFDFSQVDAYVHTLKLNDDEIARNLRAKFRSAKNPKDAFEAHQQLFQFMYTDRIDAKKVTLSKIYLLNHVVDPISFSNDPLGRAYAYKKVFQAMVDTPRDTFSFDTIWYVSLSFAFKAFPRETADVYAEVVSKSRHDRALKQSNDKSFELLLQAVGIEALEFASNDFVVRDSQDRLEIEKSGLELEGEELIKFLTRVLEGDPNPKDFLARYKLAYKNVRYVTINYWFFYPQSRAIEKMDWLVTKTTEQVQLYREVFDFFYYASGSFKVGMPHLYYEPSVEMAEEVLNKSYPREYFDAWKAELEAIYKEMNDPLKMYSGTHYRFGVVDSSTLKEQYKSRCNRAADEAIAQLN